MNHEPQAMNQINTAQTTAEIVNFIRSSMAKAGFQKAVIGVSGGVDSAVSLSLLIQAIGKENVYPVLMPYGSASMQATIDGMSLVQGWGISVSQITRVDIKPAVDALVSTSGSVDNLRRGNMMARMRMIVLFDQAKKRQGLVVGTENKSEHLLGYFTRYGDEASDVEPIRHLYKTQVYELARYLKIPENIQSKAPSADLWFDQTDEGEFGFSYKEGDEVMSLLYDQKKSVSELTESGYSASLIQKVTSRIAANRFKYKLPIVMNI